MSTSEGNVFEAAVEFGSVTLGEMAATLGVTIDRSQMSIDEADRVFCGKRLEGKAVSFPPGDDESQTYIKGSGKDRFEVSGAFDVKKL